MKYQMILKVTGNQGDIREHEWMPQTVSFVSEAWCPTCQMIREMEVSPVPEGYCGFCESRLECQELVTCHFCEEVFPTYDALDHWGEGCNREA